jgi:hypothetical protein
VLALDDAELLLTDAIASQLGDMRLLGLDCYGFDVERNGRRMRQQFKEGPISADRIGESLIRHLDQRHTGEGAAASLRRPADT